MYRLLPLAALAVASLAALPRADAQQPAGRAAALKRFGDAQAKADAALNKFPVAQRGSKVVVGKDTQVPILSSKFNLDGTTPPEFKLGVKIWAELRDGPNTGKFVNPAHYRWAPSERFWLWFESAAPVQLSIFQTYPDSVDGARQVVPDEKYAETFKTVYPGEKFRFPIAFKMDPDTRTEYMAVVVARTDVEHLPLNGYVPPPPAPGAPPAPVGPTINTNVEVQVAMGLNQNSVYKGPVGGAQKMAFTHMYRNAATKGSIGGVSARFELAPDAPNCGTPTPGTSVPGPSPGTTVVVPPDEVAMLLFGAGKIGMQQLELNKRRP